MRRPTYWPSAPPRATTPTAWLLAILVATAAPALAQGRVTFSGTRLCVNGKPFFFLGADGVPDNLQSMRAHHLNTLFTWGKLPTEAAEAGLMLMPYIHSPNAQPEQVAQQVAALKGDPSLLAWNAGDDLLAEHLDRAHAVCETVRRLDPAHPIPLDVIDRSVPEYAPLVDMMGTYTYPLLKKAWTLQHYREWLEGARAAGGTPTGSGQVLRPCGRARRGTG